METAAKSAAPMPTYRNVAPLTTRCFNLAFCKGTKAALSNLTSLASENKRSPEEEHETGYNSNLYKAAVRKGIKLHIHYSISAHERIVGSKQ